MNVLNNLEGVDLTPKNIFSEVNINKKNKKEIKSEVTLDKVKKKKIKDVE